MTIPVIGISGRVTGEPGRQHTGVHVDYAHAVLAAGGMPVVFPPMIGADRATDVIATCHGLLLTGGEDIAPEHYGGTENGRVRDTDSQRDAFELALFGAARSAGLPVLAICRGFQLVNVALGGDLWQDLPEQRPSDLDHDKGEAWHTRTHHVRVHEGSRAAQALGRDYFLTNSFHHQAVQNLAPGLHVTAVADDGVIEAAEGSSEGPWMVCVQWHPESFWDEPKAPEQGLFQALVTEARRWQSGA
ncbi:MAG: gamma-glutamyl-gamma-aminobutyrate hydrolase family protein [Gemmatimonadales bacterium]